VPLVALTGDGKKIAAITGTGSASIDAGSTGNVTVALGMDVLSKKLSVIGVTRIAVTGGTLYVLGFNATTDSVTVTLYNPGTAAVTATVTATAVVLGF
jgi:hypothetical protein